MQKAAPFLLRTIKRYWRKVGSGLIFFIYVFISSVALVLYGPYENVRSTVIGAVLTSRHPWYAEYFYTPAALAKYKPVTMDKVSEGSMKINNFSAVHDNGIQVIPLSTKKYNGSLLVVKDPKRLHITVTKHINNVGQTVSQMVKEDSAVAGLNAGGFYDVKGKGTGGIPMGITISHGKYITGSTDGKQPVIGLTDAGALIVGKYSYQDLMTLKVKEAISFGPQLVKDGTPYLTDRDGSWGVAPRSVIGQRKDGAILLLAISGRGKNGVGASLLDCQKIMLDNGAVIAANLDGGYSTELYYKNEFLVPPSNPLGERYVATAFIVDRSIDHAD
ncbi:phosphodiester glycosidase family protein [Aneurinibacillus tyrosinisolvens]|uniref:phosphodiester glycosidase family protein n=1 Tax=Aneurinibacillus tyrosinisolvens TaxID=1443435 RepID=UPI00069BD49C|nr:phosphodiester glycosidase family protein [Aneurinibacillus tyrosinisolvens]